MKRFSTATLVKIALLSAISFLLMFFEFVTPFFPSFLKFDLSALPAVVGTLALGPSAGVCVELVKNLLDLTKTTSGGIGQVANFIMESALVVPLGILYHRIRGVKGYIAGAAAGILMMTVVACIVNYFVIIPMYTKFMPLETIIGMAAAINPIVTDMRSFILFVMAPFNFIKCCGVSVLGYILFQALRPVLVSKVKPARDV